MTTSLTVAAQGGSSQTLTSPLAEFTRDASTPAWQPDSYRRMEPMVSRARDVFANTDRMRERASKYLPQWPNEELQEYTQRVMGASPVGFFARAVRAMVGMAFSREPELGEDVPPEIAKHWENIDRKGTHGRVFAKRLLEDGLITGMTAILVDHPPRPGDGTTKPTLRDENEMELRPYWCMYVAEDIVQVRYEVQADGKLTMSLAILHELGEEPDGLFGRKGEHRFKVYRREVGPDGVAVVKHQLWRVVKAAKSKARIVPEVETTVEGVRRIPVALGLYGTVISDVETAPPLLDVVDKCIQHWRNDCELQYVLDKAARPTLIIKGANREAKEGELVKVGPDVAVYVPKEGDVDWLEFTGQSAEKLRQQKQDIEKEIAALTMAFLQSDSRAAETAEARRLDANAQNATLATSVEAEEDQLELALSFHAEFMGRDSGGSIALNRDFENIMLTPEQVSEYRASVEAGHLTLETFLQILVKGRWLTPGFDIADELSKLEEEKVDRMAEALAIASASAAPAKDGEQPPKGPGAGPTPGAGAGADGSLASDES